MILEFDLTSSTLMRLLYLAAPYQIPHHKDIPNVLRIYRILVGAALAFKEIRSENLGDSVPHKVVDRRDCSPIDACSKLASLAQITLELTVENDITLLEKRFIILDSFSAEMLELLHSNTVAFPA